MRFEMSAIMRPQVSIDEGAFSQFVFDNADFNTQTLDGLNTFHSMGGIQCVTPITAVLPDSNIERLTSMPTAQDVEDIGYIPLLRFERKGESGLKDVKINNVEHLNPVSSVIVPSATDLLWMYGKWSEESFMPGWNGFMEQATIEEPYTRSKILCLPFINAPPSDHDTILTSLMYAAKKCEKLKQHTCFVTFDQPLFLKARDIVSTLGPEYNIVVRLGGFHLLMSFMGCIGHVMAGSGLKELLMTIYAPNSLDKMLKGHAYARALRAHILTHLVLSKIVFQNIEFTAEERAEMSIILDDIDRTNVLIAESNTSFETVAEKFKQQLMQLESNGPTAKLWIQYLRMVTLVKQFVEAERMGNWKLHLATIQKMLPFFHACGHFNYAKSAHLYLQDMLQLCEKMTQDEYDRFTNKGFFTIRRTNKFWSGTWSDMCIEQELMRPIKVAGGMTERGKTSSVSTKWTMGAVYLQNVCDEIEKFCRVYFASTEQHVDMRSSRVTRDNGDAAKLFEWLSQHPPFPEIDEIMSLSSGIVGDGTINCYMAQEIGAKSMEKIINNDFHSVKFKRKDNVLPLSSVTTSVRINDVITPIQPLTIFQRMCIAKQSNEELQHYMEYELAPFPMALFNEEGMRKTPKSSLYKVFSQCADDINVENTTYVIDGGYLIHRVVWHRNQPFSSIFSSYVSFVKSHYKDNAIIVFDGYPQDNRGTKSAERNRRTTKKTCADILFDETTIPTVSQESLLANENNKRRFVTMLKQTFQDNNFIVHQATEDADTLIVTTAIEVSSNSPTVVIIGEDVDLLVLLIGLGASKDNIYFLKPGRGNTVQSMYSSAAIEQRHVAENILFLHAISGCDTTSALFNMGKVKILNNFRKNEELQATIEVFKQPDSSPDAVATAGELFLLAVYGCNEETESTLNKCRYKHFLKSANSATFNLSALPPTSSAARQHSFRVYCQVQQWYGNSINPLHWGWKRSTTGLMPVLTTSDPAPLNLLSTITCQCKKGCRSTCGCRKAGLMCSVMCKHCNGNCDNVHIDIDDIDEMESLDDDELSTIFQ